jgi:FkbH-like protein
MIDNLYSQLAWLPAPPLDFATRCRSLESAADPAAAARSLAMHALDQNQLVRLGKTIARLPAGSHCLSSFEKVRIGLISNGTLDLIVPALVATAARYGIALECVPAAYGQTMREALDPDGQINTARADAVLVAVDYRGLPVQFQVGDCAAEATTIKNALTWLDAIREGFHRNSNCTVILQTIAPPPETLFGSYDCVVAGTPRRLIANLNQAIAARVADTSDMLLDVAHLAETIGLGNWHSSALWNLAKLPFDEAFTGIYAEHALRLLVASRGRSRKCLVLDLDNTVWGGVIGDDGLEGIKTAQGDATGEAHRAVQELALNLRKRGIVLAVSSKNTDEVARGPFRSHPEMLLREEHFAVFQANWNDKATNIRAIATELGLGLDSLVFLDDNPVERALVREILPQVAVPELPDDPALYARTLTAAGYFEAVAFSSEDRTRAEMYQANARRVTLQGETTDLAAYLASLEMQITFAPFDRAGRSRIAQLINKSNQFNLTTRRYSEAEIQAAEEDASVFTLQVRLEDKFGDNGMISVIICRPHAPQVWEIDVWLMSCRVLGRQVELAILDEIVRHARERRIRTVIGTYVPTARNSLVKDHYARLGFMPHEQRADGTTRWSFATTTETTAPVMVVKRANFHRSSVAIE